jgi:hypothetical protein
MGFISAFAAAMATSEISAHDTRHPAKLRMARPYK